MLPTSISNRKLLIEVDCHIVKTLRDVDVILFLRVFYFIQQKKKIEEIVQNGLFLQSNT